MSIKRRLKDAILLATAAPGMMKARQLSSKYRVADAYRRVYFYHIRKTAGTSLNRAFLAAGGENGEVVHQRMLSALAKRAVSGEKVFVGHNKALIEQGWYWYAFSHRPAHELRLPKQTYTFTCFRDPAQRVISHYKMLKGMREQNLNTRSMQLESHLIHDDLESFLDSVDREHLLRQLYMFSPTFDVLEAADAALQCQKLLYLEQLQNGLDELGPTLGVTLELRHDRKSTGEPEFDAAQFDRLREMTEPEYKMLDLIRRERGGTAPNYSESAVTQSSESS